MQSGVYPSARLQPTHFGLRSQSGTSSHSGVIIKHQESQIHNNKTICKKRQKQYKTTWIKTTTHLSCQRWSVANSSSCTTPGGNEVKGQHWEGRALIRSKAEQLKTDTTPNPHMDFLPFFFFLFSPEAPILNINRSVFFQTWSLSAGSAQDQTCRRGKTPLK